MRACTVSWPRMAAVSWPQGREDAAHSIDRINSVLNCQRVCTAGFHMTDSSGSVHRLSCCIRSVLVGFVPPPLLCASVAGLRSGVRGRLAMNCLRAVKALHELWLLSNA